jgi:hypothetical protein
MTKKGRKRAPGGGHKPKGPISKNAGWLQARITEDLRARLEQEAAQNGRSLSQEAQVRLKESFDAPAKLQAEWGPPHIKALAQLVSRVARSVEGCVGDPFGSESEALGWHRNAFTHAAISAAVTALLAHYKPDGPVEIPEDIRKSTEWMAEEQAAHQRTPEGVGLMCALGVLQRVAYQEPPPLNPSAGTHYAEGYYVFPQIRRDLKEPTK